MIRIAEDSPREAIIAATAMSGHGFPDTHTPAPAAMTAMLATQSLRVHSQTDMASVGGAVAVQQTGYGEICGKGKKADCTHQVGTRHRRRDRVGDRAGGDP
jgi:hypothetical protein